MVPSIKELGKIRKEKGRDKKLNNFKDTIRIIRFKEAFPVKVHNLLFFRSLSKNLKITKFQNFYTGVKLSHLVEE